MRHSGRRPRVSGLGIGLGSAAVARDFDYARFTAAERREDIVPYWQNWKLGPCDKVEVFLAGKLAMTGVITERQVAYDADNHGMQLIGKGTTIWGYKSSVNTKTGSFDNMSFEEIARKVLDAYGADQDQSARSTPCRSTRCRIIPAN